MRWRPTWRRRRGVVAMKVVVLGGYGNFGARISQALAV
jgi:hypothetical protein